MYERQANGKLEVVMTQANTIAGGEHESHAPFTGDVLAMSLSTSPSQDVSVSSETNPMNAGIQPMDAILTSMNVENHELVMISAEPLTHKVVQKARKGRKIKLRMQMRILDAVNRRTRQDPPFVLEDLFTYKGK